MIELQPTKIINLQLIQLKINFHSQFITGFSHKYFQLYIKYLIKIIPTSKSTVISSIKMAAIENHLEIVEFFFQYIKEYDKTDFHLISALKVCIEKKQRNIINYLLKNLKCQ